MKDITSYIAMLPAIAIAISVFNYCQAKMAIRLGDMTPKQYDRDTMNPFAHLDVLGVIVMLLANVGWSKPIPYQPHHLSNPKWGMIQIALAGFVGNIVVAFCVYLALALGSEIGVLSQGLQMVATYTVTLCIGFAVFNLLPIPGFVGFFVLLQWLSPAWQMRLMGYQLWFFIGLIVLGQFGVLGAIMSPAFAMILGIFRALTQVVLGIFL